jgi:hypothetical protein
LLGSASQLNYCSDTLVSDPAAEFIETQGGRLFIWMKKNRCCGGSFHTLGTATKAPPRITGGLNRPGTGSFRSVKGEMVRGLLGDLHPMRVSQRRTWIPLVKSRGPARGCKATGTDPAVALS